jgi:hypothetical protein
MPLASRVSTLGDNGSYLDNFFASLKGKSKMSNFLVVKHENHELEFRLIRRRYGKKTYTWAELKHGDQWLRCGDFWPSINPPRKQLIEAAIRAKASIAATVTCE